jgi:hypothetical protein
MLLSLFAFVACDYWYEIIMSFMFLICVCIDDDHVTTVSIHRKVG